MIPTCTLTGKDIEEGLGTAVFTEAGLASGNLGWGHCALISFAVEDVLDHYLRRESEGTHRQPQTFGLWGQGTRVDSYQTTRLLIRLLLFRHQAQ